MTGSVADSAKVLRRGRLSIAADIVMETSEEESSAAVLPADVLPEAGNQPARRADDPWFGKAFQSRAMPASIHRFVLAEPHDPWPLGASIEDARNIIFQSALAPPAGFLRIEWSRELAHGNEPTSPEVGSAFGRPSEKVSEFIEGESLHDAAAWLIANAQRFFPGASFELDVLDHEEGEDALLALRIQSDFATRDFRERRHRICDAMLAAGFRRLHQLISIFQRSEDICGRQVFSWYSSVTVE